jgi:hypothetical protein
MFHMDNGMGKLRFPVDKEHIYFDVHQSRLLGNQMQHDGGVFTS